MRLAYADPPYLGMGQKLYGKMHDKAADYDKIETHAALIASLDEYDGWAYSLSSVTLREILPLAPDDVRVAAWVKPFAVFRKGVNPAYCWEPVLFKSARYGKDRGDPDLVKGGPMTTVRDFHSANIAMQRGVPGAKPESFCLWLFDILGARPSDEFTDIFPGSGGVMRAWEKFSLSLDLS